MGLLRRIVGVRAIVSLVGSVVAFSSVPLITIPELPATSGRDRFEGRLLLEPVEAPGMVMRLGEQFAYVDPDGKRWVAPAGLESDGASIPRVLYPIIGPPFDGSYLKAAVIHDAATPSDVESWQDAHRMLYYALRRCGVGETKAKIMYAAVYHFGPRWSLPDDPSPYDDSLLAQRFAEKTGKTVDLNYDRRSNSVIATEASGEALNAVQHELFDQCRHWVERENPTLEEIADWSASLGE